VTRRRRTKIIFGRARPPEVSPFLAAARAIEERERLDSPASVIGALGGQLRKSPAGSLLRGEWLGHSLHPLLTDLPLGCWLGAGLLDLFGGKASRRSARFLTASGLLFSLPTAAAGLVEIPGPELPGPRRVSVVHAVGNLGVMLLYWVSWTSRRSGRHRAGILFGLLGGSLAWITGYLGGHLSLALGVGQGPRASSDR
jgi:uncharacterized membrane protein